MSALVVLWLISLAACSTRHTSRVAAPAAPAPIAIAVPAIYSSATHHPEPRPNDICEIDPDVCPKFAMRDRHARKASVIAVGQASSSADQGVVLSGPLANAPAVRSSGYGYQAEEAAGAAPSSTPPEPIPVQPARAARGEQFDIEAKVQIEVLDIDAARGQLMKLTEAFDGQVMNEALEDGTHRRGAALSLRIPSAGVRRFVARLPEVGKVRSSSIEANEVSRALSDAAVVQSNLEHAIARYEELLAKAANVAEATQLEAELTRVRTDLARVRSDLEWSRDRVARSTVYVTLTPTPAANSAALDPVARFYPGVRAVLLIDVPPSSFSGSATIYAGGGLSFQWGRAFDIDLDFLHDLSSAPSKAIDFYALTVGTAFYSDYFGGGQRRTLNPYIGFRTGYAHAPGQSLFPLGGTVGVDLYKSERVLLGVEARAYALIGREHGPDFALEPALGLNFAY